MIRKLKRYHGGIGSSQLANIIQASPRSVRQWASLDLIPHGKSLGGHHYRFNAEQVEKIRGMLLDAEAQTEEG